MGASVALAPAAADSTSASLSGASTATLASFSAPAGTATAGIVKQDARSALDEARAAKAAAEAVDADVADSGLELDAPETTVDTDDLEVHIERLTQVDVLPAMFFASATDAALEEVAEVRAATVDLRGALDDAEKAKKAEEEAERKAAEEEAAREAAEAEAAAAEAAAAESAASSAPAPSGESAPAPAAAPPVVSVDPGSAQAIARDMAAARGWGDGEFSCLVSLWDRESGWNAAAYNASSGAFGIPQALPGNKMASAGADWQTNPATQIAWGLGYIGDRYGSPCGAWGHSQSVGWY